MPPIFLYLLIKRYALKTPAIFDGKEHKWKNFWGGYLLLSGIILVMLYPHEWFFGSWVAICGIAIFLLGSSWWAQKYEQPSLRWRIIDRTALTLTILVWLSGTIIFPVVLRPRPRYIVSASGGVNQRVASEVPCVGIEETLSHIVRMSPDEVIQIRGDPPFVIGKEKIAEDVFPTFEIKTLKNGERVQDYQGWHWPDFEGGINVFFDPERKAVIAIECYSHAKFRQCPSIAGVFDGDSEGEVIRKLGSPDSSKVNGRIKTLSYSTLGIQLKVKRGRGNLFDPIFGRQSGVFALRIAPSPPSGTTVQCPEPGPGQTPPPGCERTSTGEWRWK